MLRAIEQRFASFGQKNFLVDARKEQRAGFGFERFDLGAHRGLSQMDALRGFGEAARFGNRLKGSELPEFHKSMSSKLSKSNHERLRQESTAEDAARRGKDHADDFFLRVPRLPRFLSSVPSLPASI